MLKDFPGIQLDESLKKHSTLKVGGNADYFFTITDTAVLPELIAAAEAASIPFKIIGGGSNILFPDEGYRGLIIKCIPAHVSVEGSILTAGAGVRWPQLVMHARKAGFHSLDNFLGLPGTIGGAVFGNAGCYGVETADFFVGCTIYDYVKKEFTSVDDLTFTYRHSAIKTDQLPYIVCEVSLNLSVYAPDFQPDTMQARAEKTPTDNSSGCFFQNPEGTSAGKLIDEAGLKGYQIGGAQVSPIHANFIVNAGDATAKDILALADHIKKTVQDVHGVTLQEEVRLF